MTDSEISKLDLDTLPVDKASSDICSIILKAAKKTIPQGHRKKYKPFWTAELQTAVKARRKARKTVAKCPTPENKTEYNRLTARVRLLTRQGKRGKWVKTCENLDLNKDGKKAWKLIQNLQGKKKKKTLNQYRKMAQRYQVIKIKQTFLTDTLHLSASHQEERIWIEPSGGLQRQNRKPLPVTANRLKKTSRSRNSMLQLKKQRQERLQDQIRLQMR